MVEFLEALRIEMMERGGILVVHIDRALAVSDGKFGLATQIYRAGHDAIRGVNRRGILAAAVEGEDALGDRIENHRVSAARDVNTAAVAVYIDVVPTTLAADRDGFDNVITARARRRRGRARECYGRKDYRHCQ